MFRTDSRGDPPGSSEAPPIPTGKREQRKAVTRAELLAAARELFGRRGLYESSVEDLTRRAGIAKGTLYLYFRNKEELIKAVVESGFDELYQRIAAETQGPSTVPSRMEQIVNAHFAFLSENVDLLRIFHQVRGMLKFNRREWLPLRGPLQAHIDRIAVLLEGNPPLGRISKVDRQQLAAFLFGAVSGISSVYATAQVGRPRPEAWRMESHAVAAAATDLIVTMEGREKGASGRRIRRPRNTSPIPRDRLR